MNRVLAAAITALATFTGMASAPCAWAQSTPVIKLVTSAGSKGIETGDLNRNAEACTDFYDYANGAWRAANPIPAGKSRWSRRVAVQDANPQRITGILESVSQKTDWPKGSIEQLLGDHYASCMNVTAIDAAGRKPLQPLLAAIDAAKNKADIQRLIRRLQEISVAVPLGISSNPDYHDPFNGIANVTAGGLGLPDRDAYLKDESRFVETRARYRAHMIKVLILGGVPDAKAAQAAEGIIALETRLAEASLDAAAAADLPGTDHKMTFAEVKQLAPHFDWDRYFDEAKLPKIALNVAEPKFLRQLDQELADTPVEVWKNYLKWQLLESASPWLSTPFAEESYQFRDKYLSSATAMKPRAQICLESTDALFGEALGKKYVERHFSPAMKARVAEIAVNLRAALLEQVAVVPWMTAETRKAAMAKLADTNIQVGYPDKWKDYSGVKVRRDTFWANVAAGRKFNVADDRSQIGKPTNRDLWALDPSSAGAYLDLQLNKIVLPAGFLQPPFFNMEANDAVNYGALGINFAHDLTHAIDATGAETDIRGRPVVWWTDADRREFATRAQCVIDQYEGYFIEPGVHHKGKLVLNEAIGDLGGARVALNALKKSMQTHPVPTVDGFTPEQQFFIAWGQNAGAAMGIEAQRALVKSDTHPVPKFRVIGPFTHTPEFAEAFACKPGAQMVVPAERRCAIW